MSDLMLTLPVVNEAAPTPSSESTKKSGTSARNEYWRSFEELADSKEFDEFVRREYPSQTEVLIDPVSRRSFLKLMGASLGLAGLAACTVQPREDVIPYIKQPEEIVPGKALYFATAMPRSGGGVGLLVRSNEGRPTKIEGNPDHPASLGAADLFAQAAILGMYDPDRSQAITYKGDVKNWGAFVGQIAGKASASASAKGAGLRFLTESITSPSLAAMMQGILAELPLAKWHQYESAAANGPVIAGRDASGTVHTALYEFDKADRILSLDSDFMMDPASGARYSRDYAKKRRASLDTENMSRLYAAETTVTTTGANADNRIAIRPSQFEGFVAAVASYIGVSGVTASKLTEEQDAFAKAVAKDLKSAGGRSIVVAGPWQSAYVHSLAHQMNASLGNVGQTVFYGASADANPTDHLQSITELAADMAKGQVDTLIMLGGVNPVYNAPVDLNFAEAMKKVPFIVHHGLYYDETARLSLWHIPEAHFLEAWGDTRAHDGTVSLIQPLIAPLYGGKTAAEVLTNFTKNPNVEAHDLVKGYWTGGTKGSEVEKTWRQALNDGLIAGTAGTASASAPAFVPVAATPAAASADGIDVVFRPDPHVHDGRYANNGWLQELPKPISKLTWDNAAFMSKATAKKAGLDSSLRYRGGEYEADVVYIEVDGRHVEAPVWIVPGHPDDTITLHLGYGRTAAGSVGNELGVDAGRIRSSKNMWYATGAKIRKTGKTYELAGTQIHFTMEGRGAVRNATFEEYKKNPNYVHEEAEPSKDMGLFPKYEYKGYAWGMSIDLNSCVGCNACMIACVAENNIPVVGKEQVLRSREMHWIRVDRYYTGAAEDPDTYFQPVPCMQCENAPCELVCPVEATVHSAEGLNDMAYNRCVGTRYCGNNCPYKVRRFNFLLFQDWTTPQYKLMRNPEVTVRSRGVMEKCTYCVQRIQNAKIDSEKENRQVRDGEIVTACEASCPTGAIVFGNINDPMSRVAKQKADSRNYSLLDELNTHPRTTYLGAIRNPNPEIKRKPATRESILEESV